MSPVEEFIDVCHSLENLIDPPGRMLEGRPRVPEKDENAPAEEVPRLKSSGYMDSFINPKEYLDAQRAKMDAEAAKAKRFPESPVRDVLWFLLENAPLERWERDVRPAALGPVAGLRARRSFEARALYTDVMFIDEFLTPEFVKEHKLFLRVVEPQRPPLRSTPREF
nr:SpoVR family protein [Deltaproteobacteria bacterium]